MTVLVGTNAPWVTDYTYDACSRLSELTDHNVSNDPFVYAWHPDASLVASVTMPSGAEQTKAYDDLGRLTSIAALDSLENQINRFSYQYDAAGQRWQRTVESNTVERIDTFSYNDRRELIDVTSSGTNYNYGWSYDPIGNWLSDTNNGAVTTYTANILNQYTAISGQLSVPKYDANGNMTNDHLGNTLEWDQEDRLVKHRRLAGAFSTFPYDGISKSVGVIEHDAGASAILTNRLVYEGKVIIAEIGPGGSIQASITRGLDLRGYREFGEGIPGIIARKGESAIGYAFSDGNGNITLLLDGGDNLLAKYQYSPFGTVVGAVGSENDQPWQWSSQQFHKWSALQAFLYRAYQAVCGRWVNRDPIQEMGGLNLYAYVLNRPLDLSDRLGLVPTTRAWTPRSAANLPWRWFRDGTYVTIAGVAYYTLGYLDGESSSKVEFKCVNINRTASVNAKVKGDLVAWINYAIDSNYAGNYGHEQLHAQNIIGGFDLIATDLESKQFRNAPAKS